MRVAFVVAVAVLLVAGIVLGYLLTGRGTFQPGVDVTSRTVAAVPLHLAALQDREATIRKKAATSLWLIGAEAKEATPALLVALEDPNEGVRQAAARALGRTGAGAPTVIPGLVAALKDQHAEVRASAAGALAELWGAEKPHGSTSAIAALTDAPNEPDPRVRPEVARALTQA